MKGGACSLFKQTEDVWHNKIIIQEYYESINKQATQEN